jgi:hypothetical protein
MLTAFLNFSINYSRLVTWNVKKLPKNVRNVLKNVQKLRNYFN